MILLILFSFIAGIVTVLSPCILPILPIILSSTVGDKNIGKSRPLGVVVGFILSFTFFTLFLSTIVKLIGISADGLRYFSIFVISVFGLTLVVPKFQLLIEQLFSKLSSFAPNTQNKSGFGGGLIIGLSVGVLWTPCVGPILASVLSLAITGTVTLDAFLITLAYSLGTAIPMFLIMLGGNNVLRRVPWLLSNLGKIQKAFGILMIVTAIGIFFNLDRKFQTFILSTFPKYGAGLTQLEDNKLVRDELNKKPSENNLSKILNFKSAPEIVSDGEWFNSEPLTLEKLKGKVVIVDFWTYSCINCQRTFPYLKTWYEKYKDKGLVIIGVHSPEFEFEKNPKNVQTALKDFGLTYPVVLDNDFAIWRAYSNQYWPAKYIVDKDGKIRYTHFGEGSYDETEKMIQQLLQESGASDVSSEVNNPSYILSSRTPEIYLGYGRIDHFKSPEKIARDKLSTYSKPTTLGNNEMAYEGNWLISNEYANPKKGSILHINFDSREVFLVMRAKGTASKVRILVDGKMQDFGDDVVNGEVTITKDTLYKLVKLPISGKHNLQIIFEDDDTEVYAFTFG